MLAYRAAATGAGAVRQRAGGAGPGGVAGALLSIQRQAGNRAVTALLGGTVQRACGCGTCDGCGGAGARNNDDAERERSGQPEVTVSRMLAPSPAAGAAALFVQRAKIDYRALTWADFKGGAASGGFAATTASGIRASDPLKKLTTATDQKTPCPLPTKGKAPAKTGSMFAASVRIDPATYDGVKGFMSQEQSKVLADVVKNFAAQTAKSVQGCEKSFDAEAKQVAKDGAAQCGNAAKDCSDNFKAGNTSYQIKFGPGAVATASTAKDCSASFLKDCKAAYVGSSKPAPYNETVAPDAKCPAAPSGDTIATAATKAECGGTFKTARAAYGAGWSKNILAHEQLHFAITDKAAQDLKKELVAKAAGYKVEEAACTSAAATGKAGKAWAALGAEKALKEAETAGNKGLGATQASYDDETCHGVIPAKQAEWAKKYAKTPSKTP